MDIKGYLRWSESLEATLHQQPAVLAALALAQQAQPLPDLSASDPMPAAEALAWVEPEPLAFEELPSTVVQQLRRDGTRGELRSLEEAQEVYEQDVPDAAKVSVESIEAITNNPDIHWAHIEPHSWGGSNDASNGVYAPAELNLSIGDRPMTPLEIEQARLEIEMLAEEAAPELMQISLEPTEPAPLELLEPKANPMGDWIDLGVSSAAMAGGIAVMYGLVRMRGYRDAGREDLVLQAQQRLGVDLGYGAINGAVRGSSVLLTQAVLGANPITAGLGLVLPDTVNLLCQGEDLTPEQYQRRALGVVGKASMATALVCAGPLGWAGLLGLSMVQAYGSAQRDAGLAMGRSHDIKKLCSG